MPVFLIETESRFKMQYAVEADTFDKAFEVIQNGTDEFFQEHRGELLVDARVVNSDEDVIRAIRAANNGFYDTWSDEQTLKVFKHYAN